jgi:hypothetical protein
VITVTRSFASAKSLSALCCCAFVSAVIAAGCGGGGGGSAASSSSSASGTSTSALVSSCESDYSSGNFGLDQDGNAPSFTGTYCSCVIHALLAKGVSAQKISDAMEADATDHGGTAPIMFDQIFDCGDNPAQ